MSTGMLAATTPPKITINNSSTSGMAIISPRLTSDLVNASIRYPMATVPPIWVVRPGTCSCDLITSYCARLPLSSSAVKRMARYVACRSRDTSPAAPS